MITDKTNFFKIALIQHPPVFLNLKASLKKACDLIEEAAKEGAKVIGFPETWLPGYPVWLDFAPNAGLWEHPPAKALYRILAENSVEIPGKEVQALLNAAKKTAAYVIMGSHERLAGTLYNTMIFLDKNGRDIQIHRKLMPTYTERLIWGRGDGSTLPAIETDFGKIGGLICWEHWMPLARAAMHAKHEMLHIAQWPMVKELNLVASRQYAFEGQCFVAAAGSVLSKGEILEGFHSLKNADKKALELLEEIPRQKNDLILKGGSAVIAPNAEYIVEPVYNEPSILYGEINPELVKEGNLFLDTDGHYSRPDVFQLHVNTQPQINVKFEPRNP
jgi:predicted amidohydrolase